MSEHFHFTAAQANMKRVLALAKDFVSKASMLPVLHSVMLEGKAGDDFITVTATNLESVLRIRVAASVLNSGAMCATYTVLRDLVNTLPNDEPIEFAVQDNFRVEIVSGGQSQETNLILYDPQEFPLIPVAVYDDTTKFADLNGDVVVRVANEVAPLAATDASRPTLTGVSLRFSDAQLEAAATDGFRLALLRLPLDCSLDTAVIVPSITFGPIARLVKLIADSQDVDAEYVRVRMVVHGATNRIFWEFADGYIGTILINGTYPDFASIIPKSYVTCAKIVTKTVYQRVQVVSVVATQSDTGNATIYLEAVNDGGDAQFKMNATSVSVGDADGSMQAVITGPSVKMAVNAHYLSKSLSIFNGSADEMAFKMRSPMEPLMLTWGNDDSLLHLIMPMHQGR